MLPSLFLLFCQTWVLNVICCEINYPAVIRVNHGDTLRMKSVYLDSLIYDDSSGNDEDKKTLVEMTGRAFCVNDICSIPSPTLIVYPGTTVYIQLENQFEVNSVDEADLRGPDIINIHTHGLHISGLEDNVFDSIHPTQSRLVTWTIHPEHHLGTNWYHAHHHTNTDITVMTGMYGALIVDSDNNKCLDYGKPDEINDYIIQISYQYLIDNKYCQNCDFTDNTGFAYRDSFKLFSSSCSQWCGFDETQRENSGYQYDVNLDGSENMGGDGAPSLEVFLVNNLYQPTISRLESNKYFKLRLISASSAAYIQFEFDYNTETNCEYSLIARDGIALHDLERDLSEDPYYGYFLLPPGGRIDVMVLCTGGGIATIYHNEVHPHYNGLNNSYPMGRIGRQPLLKLDIEPSRHHRRHSRMIIDPHLIYPEPTYGFPYYLKELIDSKDDEAERICSCSNYNRDRAEDVIVKTTDRCALELVEGIFGEHGNGVFDLFEINGVTFSHTAQAIFIISLNKIYEFYLNSDGHPFHIHVNPFMVQEDLLNGYIAKKYDLMDVIGYNFLNDSIGSISGTDPENQGFLIRYNARDYIGNIILHCHFLSHEDLGMMAYMKVVDDVTNDMEYCQNNYGFNLTQNEDDFKQNDDNTYQQQQHMTPYIHTAKHKHFSDNIHENNKVIDNDYDKTNQYYYLILLLVVIIGSIMITNTFIIGKHWRCCNKPKSYNKVSVDFAVSDDENREDINENI